LAGIGIRLNGRGSAAEEDTNTEHRIRITRIARTECSPGLACGRGRIVESRAVRKSGIRPARRIFAEEGKLSAVRLKNNRKLRLPFSRSLSAVEQIYIPDEWL
jgi:hypothetical protein